jgi:hypothetical protein
LTVDISERLAAARGGETDGPLEFRASRAPDDPLIAAAVVGRRFRDAAVLERAD